MSRRYVFKVIYDNKVIQDGERERTHRYIIAKDYGEAEDIAQTIKLGNGKWWIESISSFGRAYLKKEA